MRAVVDISSTSMSMSVCEDGSYKPIYKSREVLSMISYVEGNKVTSHGMEKIADRIAIFQDQCKKLGVETLYVVSTAAMRFISNAEEVFAAVKERTGAVIIQLDGETEAYCDCTANQAYKDMPVPIVIDIGGASIEFCDLTKSGRDGINCLNFGALTLKQKYVKSVYPNKDECGKIKKYLKKELAKVHPPVKKGGKSVECTAVLVGATNRSIYEIYRDYYNIPEDSDMVIETEKLNKLAKKLIEAPDRSHLLIKNAPEKIYFIIVAIITLVQILKKVTFSSILVSDRGVKEGFLTLVDNGELKAETSPLSPEKKAEEIKSVEELTARIKTRQKAAKQTAKPAQEKAQAAEDKTKKDEKPDAAAKGGKGKTRKDVTK